MSGSLSYGKSNSKSMPFFHRGTDYSSTDGSKLSIDPSIRALQDQAVGQSNQLYSANQSGLQDFLSRSAGLRERYLGNESAFNQARVNPLLQQTATRRGELQRSIGMRGMGGSSFGEQALTNFDTDSQRAIGDARATSEIENLKALAGIDDAMWQAVQTGTATQAQLNEFLARIADARSQQELAAFGIGSSTSKSMNVAASGGMGGSPGGSTPTPSPGCYVADALYGEESPITHAIRAYVRRHLSDRTLTGWCFRLYWKHGLAWAGLVRKHRSVRRLAHRVFDRLHARAVKENV